VQVDLSFYHLVTQASLIVQIVMMLLLIASVASWTMIVAKWRTLKQARAEAEYFEAQFWSGGDMAQLYEQIRAKDRALGMELIFAVGFKEFLRLYRQRRMSQEAMAATVLRTMKVALAREMDTLEMYLSFLATVGSTSPYVGLFGTVWGIMNAFIALGEVQQATLALVAPGIAEALIATAMGLFAAIPAVIAYNRYTDEIDRLETRYENFMEEFTALLHRQSLAEDAKVG